MLILQLMSAKTKDLRSLLRGTVKEEASLPHIIPQKTIIRIALRGSLSADFKRVSFSVRKILIPPGADRFCYFRNGFVIGFTSDEFQDIVSVFRRLRSVEPPLSAVGIREGDKFELEKATDYSNLSLAWSKR